VTVIAGSSIGSFLLGLVLGSLVSIGILKLLNIYKKESRSFFVDAPLKKVEISTPNDSTMYEEIQVAEDLSTIKYSQNVAYGEALKM